MSSETRKHRSLIFQEVDVKRMPGIDPPGITLDEVSQGINVIHGPNAAGKTMLARAILTLLWPDHTRSSDVLVRGTFTTGDEDWFVEVDGDRQEFQQSGTTVPGPSLPPSSQRDRYNLALHDLIQDETTDRSFAEFILQELSGGYDVSRAADELGFDNTYSYPGKTKQRAEKALEHLKDTRNRLNELKQEEEELSKLRREKEEAADAQDRIELLKQVLDVFDAEEEREEVEQTLDEFPEVMDRVTGSERKQLDQLKQKIDSLEHQREEAKETIRSTEEELDRLEHPYDEPADDVLQNVEHKYEKVKDLEKQVQNLEEEREAAKESRNEEQAEFEDGTSPEKLADLKRPEYDALQQFTRRWEDVQHRFEALDAIRSRVRQEREEGGEEEPAPEPDELKRGCDVLENWLSNPSTEDGPSRNRSPFRHVTRGLTAVLTAWISYLVHPLLLLLLLLPAVLYVYEWFNRSSSSPAMRSSARQEFRQLDLPYEPDGWTETEVRNTLLELYEQRAKRHLDQIKEEFWNHHRDEYRRVKEEIQDLEEKRQDLADTYGLAPDTDARTLYHLTNRLSRWKDDHKRVKEIEGKLENKRHRYEQLLTGLNDEFQNWNLESAESGSDVRQRLLEMKNRINSFREAKRTLEQARDEVEKANSKQPEVEGQLNELYTRLNLESGDEAGLQKLLERREDYRELQGDLNKKEGVVNKEREVLDQLCGTDAEIEQLLSRDRAGVEREIQELEETAASYEEKQADITKIETKLDQAREEYEMEPALAAKERAFDALRDQLNSDYRNMAGDVLTKYVQQVNTDRTMPAVFDRARELLSRITGGRYELRVDRSENPSFRVVDTVSGQGHSLNELSGGTRIQVLLSVRLAFCQQVEEGFRLPLFMDETLANADDARAKTIIESVLELSREGRQVFYFTAQGDEVAKWRSVAGHRDRTINLLDLEQQLNRVPDGSVDVPERTTITEEETVPSVGDLDHDAYGERLDVPPLNPRRDDVDAAHLWYLIEDVDVLETLLKQRIERWGPLTTLLEHGGYDPDSAARNAIRSARERAEAMETFVSMWQKGRNRPINRSVLEETDAVTDNFIEEVSALCDEVEGDPQKIVDRLREGAVKRFQNDKKDELEAFLIQEGYIDRSDPMDPDHIRAAMLSTVDEDVLEEPEAEIDRLWKRIHQRLSTS